MELRKSEMATPGDQVTRRQSSRIAQLQEKASSSSSSAGGGGVTRKRRKLGSATVDGGDSSPPPKKTKNGDSSSPPKETKSGSAAVDDGPKTAAPTVTVTLREFNKQYLHFVQEEEKRCGKTKAPKVSKKSKKSKAPKGSKSKRDGAGKEDVDTKRASKRPDLKTITKMREMKTCINSEKRIGSIPGIEVGHQFLSRAEMVVVGCHGHWICGIDYIGKGKKREDIKSELPVATAIVVSGMYEDDLDNCEEITYTGQGGNNLLGDKRQIKDQEMTRGNLGLKNAYDADIPIRVVRGHKCTDSYVGKVYTYDGLYKVVKHWPEKGVSGFTVFKYKLKRIDGQPPLTTSQVLYSRSRALIESGSEIRGLVCEDITGGLEGKPIPATNLVDDPPVAPTGFTYRKDMEYIESVKIPPNAPGCKCQGTCTDPKVCACAKLNGSDFPYVLQYGGRLIEAKDVVFECNPNCGCGPDCVNRISQKGIKYRLELFRTPNRGWGVRSWDYIPSGAPICEYIGRLVKTSEIEAAVDNSYFFEIDCLQTMKGMEGRERRLGDVSLPSSLVDADKDPEFCIDAGLTGNVARYINHSCEPNLFVQCILSSHHDPKLARIVLMASDNIPPLTELTYDYGYILDSVAVEGPNKKVLKLKCRCGATGCRKWLY